MDTRKIYADITETAHWDHNSLSARQEDLTELRNEDGETVAYSSHEDNTDELVKRWNAHTALVEALDMTQEALAAYRDGNKVLLDHPSHGPIVTLEELKYLVVDTALEAAK